MATTKDNGDVNGRRVKTLVIGGYADRVRRDLAPKLAKRGFDVAWHWNSDVDRQFRPDPPPAGCEAVLVFTDMVNHGLNYELLRRSAPTILTSQSWSRIASDITLLEARYPNRLVEEIAKAAPVAPAAPLHPQESPHWEELAKEQPEPAPTPEPVMEPTSKTTSFVALAELTEVPADRLYRKALELGFVKEGATEVLDEHLDAICEKVVAADKNRAWRSNVKGRRETLDIIARETVKARTSLGYSQSEIVPYLCAFEVPGNQTAISRFERLGEATVEQVFALNLLYGLDLPTEGLFMSGGRKQAPLDIEAVKVKHQATVQKLGWKLPLPKKGAAQAVTPPAPVLTVPVTTPPAVPAPVGVAPVAAPVVVEPVREVVEMGEEERLALRKVELLKQLRTVAKELLTDEKMDVESMTITPTGIKITPRAKEVTFAF